MTSSEGRKPAREIAEEFIAGTGLSCVAFPTWGYGEPIDQIFPEEAPTIEQRTMLRSCVSGLATFVEGGEPRPNIGVLGYEVTAADVIEGFENHREDARQTWQIQHPEEPFPDFTLTHLIGATKRQIAWFKDLSRFEEIGNYDRAFRSYEKLKVLLEEAIKLEGEQSKDKE